jgi:hypothetical protein
VPLSKKRTFLFLFIISVQSKLASPSGSVKWQLNLLENFCLDVT